MAVEILSRNLQLFSKDPQTDKYLSSLVESAATMILKKFYSHFDMLIAAINRTTRLARRKTSILAGKDTLFATRHGCHAVSPGTC